MIEQLAKTRAFSLVDVFTDRPLGGNPLAIVQDADGLDQAAMLGLARETRLSETAFLQSSTLPGTDYRLRIWTVSGEIPFAGHPSLGAAYARARGQGMSKAVYEQQTEAGVQRLDVALGDGKGFASMLQEPPHFGPNVEPREVFPTVGLDEADAHANLPPQVVSTGLPTLLAPTATPSAVSAAVADYKQVGDLLANHDAVNLYLAYCEPERARARTFQRSAEAGEDPGTGSAAGPLCAYLALHHQCDRLEILQGVEICRPSRLFARLDGDTVRVGGEVVPVLEGGLLIK